MRVIERPFSEFLRQPNDVVAELADHDVVLRRRNAPALRLSEADRDDERNEAFEALARLIRNALAHNPSGMDSSFDEVFPWARFLPPPDHAAFIDELSRLLVAASSIGSYAPIGQLLREWRATAEVHADPRLAHRLKAPLDAAGDSVPVPN